MSSLVEPTDATHGGHGALLDTPAAPDVAALIDPTTTPDIAALIDPTAAPDVAALIDPTTTPDIAAVVDTTAAPAIAELTTDATVTPAAALVAAASTAGLAVLAAAQWPESPTDVELPRVPGFVVSAFNPLVAAVAERCLERRPATAPDGPTPVTAVILVSALGDLTSAEHVATTLDAGGKVGPLLFFQSVPNAIAGHVATRWSLTGPVVCVAGLDAALAIAALLIADGDTEQALIVRVELTDPAVDTPDLAAAVLVGGDTTAQEGGG